MVLALAPGVVRVTPTTPIQLRPHRRLIHVPQISHDDDRNILDPLRGEGAEPMMSIEGITARVRAEHDGDAPLMNILLSSDVGVSPTPSLPGDFAIPDSHLRRVDLSNRRVCRAGSSDSYRT
jgi:hypothetical protein